MARGIWVIGRANASRVGAARFAISTSRGRFVLEFPQPQENSIEKSSSVQMLLVEMEKKRTNDAMQRIRISTRMLVDREIPCCAGVNSCASGLLGTGSSHCSTGFQPLPDDASCATRHGLKNPCYKDI